MIVFYGESFDSGEFPESGESVVLEKLEGLIGVVPLFNDSK